MKKQIFVLCVGAAFAVGVTLPTEPVPVLRETNSLHFSIQHRFKRAVGSEQTGTFAGGAGVNYRLDYEFLKRGLVELGYTSNENELVGGLRYSHPFHEKYLQGSVGITFFQMDTKYDPARNLRYDLSFSSNLIKEHVMPSVSLVYNGYFEQLTDMAGIRISPIESFHIIGEMGFTAHQVDLYKTTDVLPWLAGLAYTTYAHQFDLFASNSTQTGAARSLMGGESGNVYLGFRITRLFQFGD